MLPSQFGQPKSRKSHMYRRRRSNRRRALLVLLIALCVSVGVWFMRSSASEGLAQRSDTEHAPAQTDASDTEATNEHYLARDSTPQSVRTGSTSDRANQEQSVDRGGHITMGRPVQSRATTPSQQAREVPSATSDSKPESKPEPDPQPATEPKPQTQTQQAPELSSNDRHDRDRQVSDSFGSPTATPAQRERAMKRVEAGIDLLRSNQPVEARRVLTHALESAGIDEQNAQRVRETLTELNERLLFSPEIVRNDPFTYGYTVRPGDSLARIRSREGLAIDWRFIQRVNRISRPERIQVGQDLKLVTGPFHAVVHKSDYRMDLYLGDGSQRVYVRSFPVGLGEYNSTPVGMFRVSKDSKLIDPAWTNPRTGEHFESGDPENPIGTRWIGMEGISEAIRGMTGYGIHGTIEPDSIGRQASMGCVRMHTDNVELVYELLTEEISTVVIKD